MSRITVHEVKSQIDTHEAVCAERWLETINRVKRLEIIIMTSAGAIITLLLSLLSQKI
jgi:hypothetical protein